MFRNDVAASVGIVEEASVQGAPFVAPKSRVLGPGLTVYGRWYGNSRPAFEEDRSRFLATRGPFLYGLVLLLLIHFPISLGLWGICLLLYIAGILCSLHGGKRDTAFRLELEDGPEAARVKVRIFQKDILTGEDRGALLFDGGRMCFSGENMSFAIAPGDIDVLERKGSWALKNYPPLWLRHPSRRVGISLEPLEFDSLRLGAIKRRFFEIESHLDQRGQLPPLTFAPWIWSRGPKTIWRGYALWIGTLLLSLASAKAWSFYDCSFESLKYALDAVLLALSAGACLWTIRKRALLARLDAELRSGGAPDAS